MKTALQAVAFAIICLALLYVGITLAAVQGTLTTLVDSHSTLVDDYNSLAIAHNDLAERYEALDSANRELTAQYFALSAKYENVATLLSPPVEAGSAIYDCDDATLDAFRFYTERDYPVCIVAGNLARERESRFAVDHVWLLVRFEGGWLPIDWGAPALDRQHFEGYRLTTSQLMLEVRGDFLS